MKCRLSILILFSSIFLSQIVLAQSPVNNKKAKPFISSALTPAGSFTSGIEGPAVGKDGLLYVNNYTKRGVIGVVSPNGSISEFIELPGKSVGNGMRFGSNGDMFIADYVNHNIFRVDMKTKELSVYAHESQMYQPNDIAIDDKDRIYASDPNWKAGIGRVWRIDTNGEVTLIGDSLGTANGIEVSPDNKTLYVNETAQRKVWAYDLSESGTISNKRLLIEFPDFGMDGMRCDTKGNLYITRYGKGTVAKVSPKGKIIREIELGGKSPSNIAFGGDDGKTAYVTVVDNKNVESFRVDKPGREWKMSSRKKKQ